MDRPRGFLQQDIFGVVRVVEHPDIGGQAEERRVIGCAECRKKYNAELKAYLAERADQMCDTCKERYDKNPLRILDCKEEGCRKLCASAPKITDYLCDECKAHFNDLQKYLTLAGISFKINPYIVRGLDYYTRTVFEFVTTDLGSQGTVCGGGRYDNLVSQLGGASVPCVGFGMGVERLLMLMEAKGVLPEDCEKPQLYIASMGEKAFEKAFALCVALRAAGVSCELDHMGKSVKAQFKYADKIGAKFVLTIGENELENGKGGLKRMSDGVVSEVALTAESIFNGLIG